MFATYSFCNSTYTQVFDLLVDLLAGNYNIQHDQTFGISEIQYQIKGGFIYFDFRNQNAAVTRND